MRLLVEIVGWVAALLILIAYALLSTGRLEARSRGYHVLNLLGATGFVINSGSNGAWPSAVLNIVWMGIGFYALYRFRASRRT